MEDSEIIQSVFNQATNDRFIAVIDLPAIMKDGSTRCGDLAKDNEYKLATTVKGAIFPKIVVPPTKVKYAGSQIMLSSHARDPYDTSVLEFYITNDWRNYLVIQEWLNLLHDEVKGYYNADNKVDSKILVEKAVNYLATFTIYVVDEFGKPVLKGTYTNAFPVGLSEVKFRYEDAKEIPMDLEFGFSRFVLEPVTELP